MFSVELTSAEIKVAMGDKASVDSSNKLISTWALMKSGL